MKRRLAVGVGVAAVAVAAAVLTGRGRSSGPVTSTRVLMGTSWSIQAVPPADSSRQAARAAIRAAWAEVARVEAVMSEWQPESPVSAVNAAAGRPDAVEVPAELAALLQRAIELGRLTDGAFDVTWKGMGRLWDLGADDFAPPSQGEIDAARKRVDYRKLTVEGHRVRLPAAGMAVGLGGIAKGYGIDRAAAVLREAGITDFAVDGGGDVRVSGRLDGHPWRVGVRDPRRPGALLTVVETPAGAVVTSGDYERFREVNGVRYHHIIDPRTGRPARGCQSVTVIAPDAERADALATGLFVLGPADALALVARLDGVEALIVDADGEAHRSAGFAAHEQQ